LVFLICACYFGIMALIDASEAGLLFSAGVVVAMLAVWGL
jgi:hypothetical protein